MRLEIFGIIALLAFATSAQAQAPGECEQCRASLHSTGLRPDVRDKVCIFFKQPYPGSVVLTLHFKEGGTRIYSRPKQAEDSFCVGRHWVKQSVAADLCNLTSGSAKYSLADVEVLAEKPKDSRELTACLHGTAACAEMDLP